MKNKTKIKITYIKNHGKFHDQFCGTVLMLRSARNVNDIEIINNTVLGRLRNYPSDIKFEILN